MGHKNYSNFFKNAETEKNTEVNEVVSPVEEVVNEVVEPVEENNEVATNLVLGVVECERLYMRGKPSKESKHLAILPKNTEVTIDETESTEDFYKVCTAAGIEGYCMKKFIVVK